MADEVWDPEPPRRPGRERFNIERPEQLHVEPSSRSHGEHIRISRNPKQSRPTPHEPGGDFVFVSKKKDHSRRKSGRHFPEPQKIAHQPAEQDNDDLLNDYYDGQPLPFGIDTYDSHAYAMPYPSFGYPTYAQNPFSPAGAAPPPPRPPTGGHPAPSMSDSSADGVSEPYGRFSRPIRMHGRGRQGYYKSAPLGYKTQIWNRAAAIGKHNDKLTLAIKLVLTRHGERYTSRSFTYEQNGWDDIMFAHRLKQEYRTLKTKEIGFLQKLTSYKVISFVYFLQFRAYPDERFESGRWEISARQPITPNDNDSARSSFMYQLQMKSRTQSSMFSTMTGTPKEPDQKVTKNWVRRLDNLIEPGTVIDLEVKETFDSMKIYLGLLLGILLSLGVALAYGFTMDSDFSTGFSIASWLITAFGFFAAVVAAGEYLGLDSPRATLLDPDELTTGRMLHPDHLDGYRPHYNAFHM